ncbi:hypothetical protein KKG20_00645 [bacterium]|nr:hypothetical protein [bacterium]
MKNIGIGPLCLLLIFCLLVFALLAYAFDSELWPGEGRPVFRSKTDHLVLYKQPSKTSGIVDKFKINKGEVIIFDQTRYRNIKAGKIKVLKLSILQGRSLGNITYLSVEKYYHSGIPSKDFLFNRGDIFDYLQDRAEGSGIIRWKGEIIDLEYCPWFDRENRNFNVMSEPINEWWIRVIKNQKPVGWLLVDENIVEKDRTF